MLPPREVGHLRQDRQGHVGKSSSSGHTCPGESGKEDFLYKGKWRWHSRSPQGYLWGWGVTSGASFLDRSLYPFHILSGHSPVLNIPKAIGNKHSKKPGTGNKT